jgi:hypothetical protein
VGLVVIGASLVQSPRGKRREVTTWVATNVVIKVAHRILIELYSRHVR